MKPDTKYGTATKNIRDWNGTAIQCLAKYEPWYEEDATNGDGICLISQDERHKESP